MEQLKGIKKELGMESDGKDKLVDKFKKRVLKLKLPLEVQTVFDEEINKLGKSYSVIYSKNSQEVWSQTQVSST